MGNLKAREVTIFLEELKCLKLNAEHQHKIVQKAHNYEVQTFEEILPEFKVKDLGLSPLSM